MREACRRSSCQNPISEAARPDSYTSRAYVAPRSSGGSVPSIAYVAAAGLRRIGVFQNDGLRSTPRKLRMTEAVSALTPAGDPG